MRSRLNWSLHRVWLLSITLGLANCAVQLPVARDRGLPANMDPLAYFTWATHADAQAIELEMTRLQKLVEDHSTIGQVQQAALFYVMSVNDEEGMPAMHIVQDLNTSCGVSRRCHDYLDFSAILKSLTLLQYDRLTLRMQRDSSEENNLRNLDKIRMLEQQIEALTNVEQKLLEREQDNDP